MIKTRKLGVTWAVAATWVLAGTSLPAQQTQRYEVAGTNVAVYNLVGEVSIEPGRGSAVLVEVTLRGPDADELRVEQGPIGRRETLRIVYPADRIHYPERHWGSTTLRVREDGTFGHDERGRRSGRRVRISGRDNGLEAAADLRILVPSGQRFDLYLAVGEVSVSNVDGNLQLDTHSAPVTASGTRGSLIVDVGSGWVDVSDAEGDVDIDTGSGTVEVTNVRGDELRIDTGSGEATASRVDVSSLFIDTGSGSIDVSMAAADAVRLDTGSGSVTLELTSDARDIEIDTGSGSVTVFVPESFGARVEIETGSGGIDLDMPLQVSRWGRSFVSGTIGDGGGRLLIDTGSGGVRIRRR
ncbi:MAG: DUF4097 family beta strand repeat protein [Gemmatimonadales bacterium]|nr:DUF4097 family beta strand repeat protein [Gemmatimonadales bacterium]NIN12022.1 DUF4097 family beta strand repeat protein [Gemmatimonadales bacterium]NIN50553.1 DUF4097 family beta strand repeat protein [Gemmatimonadales bacterium]NIP08017.1 DUF4097 family beta strand repeat protein [Gemmatimonadales bacterium]NIR02029.1 DUF4097 family beta strand repeat protein [Gemmatimonadales bacterium]